MSKDFFVNTCENAPLRRSPNEQMGRVRRLADAEVGNVPADSLQRTSPETPANPPPLWARLGYTPSWKPHDPVLWEPRRTKIFWFLKMRLLPLPSAPTSPPLSIFHWMLHLWWWVRGDIPLKWGRAYSDWNAMTGDSNKSEGLNHTKTHLSSKTMRCPSIIKAGRPQEY